MKTTLEVESLRCLNQLHWSFQAGGDGGITLLLTLRGRLNGLNILCHSASWQPKYWAVQFAVEKKPTMCLMLRNTDTETVLKSNSATVGGTQQRIDQPSSDNQHNKGWTGLADYLADFGFHSVALSAHVSCFAIWLTSLICNINLCNLTLKMSSRFLAISFPEWLCMLRKLTKRSTGLSVLCNHFALWVRFNRTTSNLVVPALDPVLCP